MNAANNASDCSRTPDWPARYPVLPTISATDNGPLSRWSTACEQYLDSSQAVKIEAYQGQDQKSGKFYSPKPQFAKVSDTEHRAAGLTHITLPARATANNQAEGPKTAVTLAVAGLSAEAWEVEATIGVL